MRIAIDINGMTGESSGLSNYIRLLVENLAAVDHGNEYLLYLHQWRKLDYGQFKQLLPQQPNFKLISNKTPNLVSLSAEYRFGINLTEMLIKKHGIDVYHGPSNIVPYLKTIKSVMTIHHYISVSDPMFREDHGTRDMFYFSATQKAAKTANRIISVSEYTKKDLVTKLGIPSQKIAVVYPGGPHPIFQNIKNCILPPALAAKLTGKFLLFPGPINSRKNLPLFLEAFSHIKEKLAGYTIAITTNPSASVAATISALTKKIGLVNRVVLLGEISDQEMAILYNLAECLIYPSLYEGFGFPPLEAMACGCPVAASNMTALPETTGGAALLFDPTNKESIAQALLRITSDRTLRQDLIDKGFKRIKAFSRRRMAEEHVRIYEDVLQDATANHSGR